MKTVSIRELHERTGEVVREASRVGEIRITDRGTEIASIVAAGRHDDVPYFARRRPSAAFRKLDDSGATAEGPDSTLSISEDRDGSR